MVVKHVLIYIYIYIYIYMCVCVCNGKGSIVLVCTSSSSCQAAAESIHASLRMRSDHAARGYGYYVPSLMAARARWSDRPFSRRKPNAFLDWYDKLLPHHRVAAMAREVQAAAASAAALVANVTAAVPQRRSQCVPSSSSRLRGPLNSFSFD